RLAQRRNELVVHMIDLDRREPQPRETGRRTRLTQQAGERVPGLAVAITAEVDPGQHHLAVALCDPAPDLGEHGLRAAAAGAAAHERDDTEVAREATAVLHLDEGANAVEPDFALYTADRADVARHERGRLLARPHDDVDVRRHAGERFAAEIGSAA